MILVFFLVRKGSGVMGNSLTRFEEAFKKEAHNGLDKEQLAEPGKGEVITHQLQPAGQQCQQMKAIHIRIIHPRCKKGHGQAHDAHGSGYDGGFK